MISVKEMTGGQLREHAQEITEQDGWFSRDPLAFRLWEEVQRLDTEIRVLKKDNEHLRSHEAWKLSRKSAVTSYRKRLVEKLAMQLMVSKVDARTVENLMVQIDAVPLTEDK